MVVVPRPSNLLKVLTVYLRGVFHDVDDYFSMQESHYEVNSDQLVKTNHSVHNLNPNLIKIGFSSILAEPQEFRGENALDFGCGGGRNLLNLASFNLFSRIDGVDISSNNLKHASDLFKKTYPKIKHSTYKNSIHNLGVPEKVKYKFVFSTIVLQHIASWELRQLIFEQIFQCLKSGGVFSFQMGFNDRNLARNWEYPKNKVRVPYRMNFHGAKSTNGKFDVTISHPQQIVKDLEIIGFKEVEWVITPSFANNTHCAWIWFNARRR